MDTNSMMNDLQTYWNQFGPNEKKVLYIFATRLLTGQRLYGKITPKKKNWVKESLEEQLDSSVYNTVSLLELAGLLEEQEELYKEGYSPVDVPEAHCPACALPDDTTNCGKDDR